MYRNIRRAMAVMFGLALSAALTCQVSAQEDPMQDVTQDEPIADTSVADGYGKGCCDTGCCGGSFYGEFQWVNLDSYSTEDAFDQGSVGTNDGFRLIGGYQGCDGLGVRARWFDFDGVDAQANNDQNGLDLSYFDLEVTEAISICNLHGLVSAGYRHGEYTMFSDDDAGDPDVDFEGDGVTLGILLQRDIGCNLGLYAWVQQSFLYGDDDADGGANAVDTLMGWTEVQLGAQYSTCVGGYNAFARAGVEAQRHEGMGDEDTQDSGLLGWFLSAGVGY